MAPETVYLKDYSVPAFFIPKVELDIELAEDDTSVKATLAVERNKASAKLGAPLQLDIDELTVESVIIDGVALATRAYIVDERHLTIANVPDTFELITVCRIQPSQNSKLMGLYTSAAGFFSLCEAEGFRRITPFPDRPDVMACYTVTLHADRERYPILLANGNLIAEGQETGGRHWATWQDPFPKPCYLFAVVAALLDRRADHFVTRSGRKVALQFFAEPGKLDQGVFALEALKKAMKWDEETYGLEVDLDQYNVVAVEDFNAGAMENKGLNIFNTKLVLARQDISTDFDFSFIDRTVAHEYFHNWTGNRVTCRDWFQLSLKEGLTVFREEHYAGDMYSKSVARIQKVRQLRSSQFSEDAGPMAHPVRPPSYEQISNFYTSTVYAKGAEVVRMMHTLVDPEAVRHVRLAMRRFLAERLEVALRKTYDECTVPGSYSPDAVSAGRRALRNLCLAYLMELETAEVRGLCVQQLQQANNMSDSLSAISALANCDCPERLPALDQFYVKWKDEPLVVDKWLGVEAASRLSGTVARVKELTSHPAFTLRNPNKVYALLGTFGGNQAVFHATDGSGYALMSKQILALDPINPQVAARMARNFERWKRFEPNRQKLMKAELARMAAVEGLSRETAEVVTKALA